MVGWKWWVVSQQVVFVCVSAILGRVTFAIWQGFSCIGCASNIISPGV